MKTNLTIDDFGVEGFEKRIFFHYAKIDNIGDIPVEIYIDDDGYSALHQIHGALVSIYRKYDEQGYGIPIILDRVLLISFENEVFVTDNTESLLDFVANLDDGNFWNNDETDSLFLQEYPSFEEAYAVALSMKEGNKLCYSDDNLESPYWQCAKKVYLNELDNVIINLDEK